MCGTAVRHKTTRWQFPGVSEEAGWDKDSADYNSTEFFREKGGRQTPVVLPLLQQQQQQLSEEFQSGPSGRKIPAKPKGKVPLQQQQKPEIKKSSLDEKINAVGIIHSDPFIPLEVPQHIVNQEINKRIYDSFKLKNTPENFIAGKTKCFKHNWFKITSDSYIRKTICGYKLEMEDIPSQKVIPKPIKFSHEEQEQINKEIDRFLECGIIEKVNEINEGEFISNIFFRPKKDGKIRIILNLKNLNKNFLEKVHFKMETLQSAINAMRKNCYFGSVDLAEAFYSIPVREQDKKYFRFMHNGQKFQFTALIMGLTHSPRIFTKVLKPIFARLRSRGHVSSAYIDDSCLQGSSYHLCQQNIEETVQLMDSLGLTVQPHKSVFEPMQQIIFLGFLLCSVTMTVRLPPERRQEIIKLCSNILLRRRITIRNFSKLIGKLVATQQGVEYAPLFYKPLEKIKEYELRRHHGKYNSFMTVPKYVEPTIEWWIHNVDSSYKLISHGKPKLVIYSDASKKGWGAFNETENIRTGGEWSVAEQESHINILELKACQLSLHSFCKNLKNLHVRVFLDNMTSCSYINKLGGKNRRAWLYSKRNLVLVHWQTHTPQCRPRPRER